jgi:nitrogen fixation protein FixH
MKIHFPEQLDADSIKGTIILFRPDDAGQDKKIPLLIGSDHQQIITMHNLAKGLWRVKIFWREAREEFYQEETVVIN